LRRVRSEHDALAAIVTRPRLFDFGYRNGLGGYLEAAEPGSLRQY
jgi:hypothetical protein